MLKIVTAAQMREIEAAADATGLSYATMMQNAGHAAANRVLKLIRDRTDMRVTVLIGPGNNGGDGLVAGRVIAENSSAQVRFYLLKQRADNDPNYQAAREAGLFFANAEDDQRFRVLQNMIATSDIILDALFGIGIHLPLRDNAARLLQVVNRVLAASEQVDTDQPTTILPDQPTPMQRQRPYVLAIDCPSGLDCDTGEIDQNAVYADETITFIAAKPGLLHFPGAQYVGRLAIATIGVVQDLPELERETIGIVSADDVRQRLPQRPLNAHKGTFGKALIVAGSGNYIGAPALAAQAAYRIGVGLVTVCTEQNIIDTLAAQLQEVTWMPMDAANPIEQAATIATALGSYSGLLVGPGWGRAAYTRDLLQHLLKEILTHNTPLVIDADGLNLLTEINEWWQLCPPHTIITPHPGEMARLCGTDIADVQANRWTMARDYAEKWHITVVLKGAHTVIAAPDGRMAVLPFKTDSLAKAGTGDVLAGMVVGLSAQGIPPLDAALAAAYLHGLSGIEAARSTGHTRSVLAGGVARAIGRALTLIE